MSRRKFVAGNWKMNLRSSSAVQLVGDLLASLPEGDCEIAVCPPSLYIPAVALRLRGTRIGVGGQNLWGEKDGAFTGEINGEMLVDCGCAYVILGHSERRQYAGETDAMVASKLHSALAVGLVPIVCVGETLAQRDAGETQQIVTSQLHGSLADIDSQQASKVVVAYEPVWAIGTGRTATPQQAEEVHLLIRELLGDRFGASAAAAIRIQYGGSVKPSNAADLLSQPNIDGALVGGASLKVEDFIPIIAAAAQN